MCCAALLQETMKSPNSAVAQAVGKAEFTYPKNLGEWTWALQTRESRFAGVFLEMEHSIAFPSDDTLICGKR